jgi:hypothetical protein
MSIPWDDVDAGIRPAVRHLADHGIETFSSCQGGPGHSFAMPNVMFHGDEHAGLYAVWLLESHGYHVWQLSRHWFLNEGAQRNDEERRWRPIWEVQMRTLEPHPPLRHDDLGGEG